MWEVRVRHVAFLAALLCTSALALNPNHRLTQYVHRVWQSQPGLPQASIYTVTQTHDGYLWLGTQSGVVRFDGVRFTPVRALDQASLGSTWFRRIVEDNTGRVWLLADEAALCRSISKRRKFMMKSPTPACSLDNMAKCGPAPLRAW